MRKFVLMLFVFLLSIPVFAQNASIVSVVSQRFESGEMIYRRDNGDIYVISNASGMWWRFSSSQYGRLSENRQTAPASRISPINGFGRIWANNETIRRELGWATNVEIAFDMRFTAMTENLLYLTRLNGIILELSSNSTWRTVSAISTRHEAVISRFNVSPASIAKGNSISISWEASGSDFVQIALSDSENPTGTVTVFDNLALSGSLEWTVPESIEGDLIATISAVNHVQSTSVLCCYDWLSSLSRTVDVFTDNQLRIETQAAYQQFELGFMIWREDNSEVRVFYNDGRWQVIQESLYIISANNPYILPETCTTGAAIVNAFWAVWSGGEYLELACPVNNEQGYMLQITANTNGSFSYSLPDGRTITVTGNHWR